MADTRVHGTTRRHVGKHFMRSSGPRCCRCRLEPFPSFREARRRVHRDGHVEVEHAYYSVPPEYLAREVWVRWDARLVRIFNDRMEQLEVHPGRARSVQHARRRTSPRRRSAASSGVRPGNWPGCGGWGRRVPAGPRAWSRRGASRRCGC